MADETLPVLMSQAEFARLRGVSRKAVTVWKSKGLLVLSDDGRVDVDATEWNLDQRPANYRGGVTHRPVRAPDGNNFNGSAGNKPKQVTSANPEAADDGGDAVFDMEGGNLSHAEAVRRKENYLGLLRKHEFEVSQKLWVKVEDVALQVEREYATVRERLLTIPGKVAASLAGADQTTIEAGIRREITEALYELHDSAGLAGRAGADGETADGPPGAEAAA